MIDKLWRKTKKIIAWLVFPKAMRNQTNVQRQERFYNQKEMNNEPIIVTIDKFRSVKMYPKGEIVKSLFLHDFERDVRDKIINLLKPGMNVLDVGANVGLYSLMADRLVGTKGRIWAFEPSSQSILRLKNNIKLNHASSISIIRKAVSGHDDNYLILALDAELGDAHRYTLNDQTKVMEPLLNTEKVATITLDNFWRQQGKPKIDFVKIDVEGGEVFVLQGASQLIRANKNIVILFESSIYCLRSGYSQQQLHNFVRDKLKLVVGGFDQREQRWLYDERSLIRAGNLWACHTKQQLETLAGIGNSKKVILGKNVATIL